MEADADNEPELPIGEVGVSSDIMPELKTVPWLRQLKCVLRKNVLLLWRRPIMLFCMIFSSVFAVLLSWPAGQDNDDYDLPPLTDCGTIPYKYIRELDLDYTELYKIPYSLTDSWRDAMPVAILSLGPMVQAISAFLMVHNEMQTKMLGVLRVQGLRESAYWASWMVPFSVAALLNSFLAAITTKLVPVHVFENTYFAGIFASFFFLQVALLPASFFLASVCGTKRRVAVWLIIFMIVGAWVPKIVISGQGWIISNAYDYDINLQNPRSTPSSGLFWMNMNTTQISSSGFPDYEEVVCDSPIMSEEQGKFFKNYTEREQVSPDEYFVGCYASAGFVSTMWNPGKFKIGTAAYFLIPYMHFNSMWGNFAGYTAM